MQERPDGNVPGEQLVIAARQRLPSSTQLLPPEAGTPGGRYLRSGLTWDTTHRAVARDLFSVATRERCERLASHLYSSGTAWVRPSAASLASLSASSLPAIPAWEGTQRAMTSLPPLTMREHTSMAKC